MWYRITPIYADKRFIFEVEADSEDDAADTALAARAPAVRPGRMTRYSRNKLGEGLYQAYDRTGNRDIAFNARGPVFKVELIGDEPSEPVTVTKLIAEVEEK